MHLPRPTRAAGAAVLATALALTGLVMAAPAQAASNFTNLTLKHSADAKVNKPGEGCNWFSGTSNVPNDIAVLPNTAKTSSVSILRDAYVSNNMSDTMVASASESGTVRTATQGSNVKSVSLDFTGKAAVKEKNLQGATESATCYSGPEALLQFNYSFTTNEPLWATLSYSKQGATYTEAWIQDAANQDGVYEELYGWSKKGSGSTTVLLPAGKYFGYVSGETVLGKTKSSVSTISSGKVRIDFAPMGSATAKPSGKAQGYAALGSARSCAVHALPAKLSSSSKRIKSMKKISFAVNGKTAKTLKGRAIKRGLALKLPIGDAAAASVKTTVRLKSGKTITATAAYRPCG